MKHIFLDTETTGLHPNGGDRIVEIAAIAYEGRRRIPNGEYHCYLNPERDMPKEAQEIHGLTHEFLADKPTFADIVESFIAFIQGGELIIHNAAFDEGFLDAELNRLNKPPLNTFAKITCSLAWARLNHPSVGGYSLNALCRHFNVNLDKRREYHSAIVDTQLLGELYFRMRQQQAEIEMNMPPLNITTDNVVISIRRASAEEVSAHHAFLAQMEKDTGVPPLYRQFGA